MLLSPSEEDTAVEEVKESAGVNIGYTNLLALSEWMKAHVTFDKWTLQKVESGDVEYVASVNVTSTITNY